jgi:hypothetical protein
MSIDKIAGISSFKLHPDQMKKDSARKNPQTGDRKVRTEKEARKEAQIQVNQQDSGFSAEKLHKAAQQTKELIEDYIAQVKSQATVMQKFYPPYPPGSEARVQMLKDVPAFRDQIERLSAAPDGIDYSRTKKDVRIQDLEAEIKSMEIRNSLTDVKTSGITVTQSEFTGLY